MITKNDVVATAREWLGTPFQHQGRVRGVGVDCAGLVLEVARTLGILDVRVTDYSRQPHGDLLRSHLDAHMIEIPIDSAVSGDVYLMRFDGEPQHLSIVTENGIIHAYSFARKCVEHCMDDKWRRRIYAAYAFRGVA